MTRFLTLLLTAAALVLVGCGSIFDDDSVLENSQECWAEIYEDANFIRDTPWTRLQGPSEISRVDDLAGYDWNDRISSLRVGPDAIVQLYEHADFRGEVREYGYGRYVDNLQDENMNDTASAIKIRCR